MCMKKTRQQPTFQRIAGKPILLINPTSVRFFPFRQNVIDLWGVLCGNETTSTAWNTDFQCAECAVEYFQSNLTSIHIQRTRSWRLCNVFPSHLHAEITALGWTVSNQKSKNYFSAHWSRRRRSKRLH